MGLLIHEFDRLSDSSIIAAFAAVMFIYSSRNVGSGAGVERAVSAFKNIDVPHKSSPRHGPSTRPTRKQQPCSGPW